MEVTLTHVQIIRKTTEETRVLKDGDEIEYYGQNYGFENDPEIGTVKITENNEVLIVWEDGTQDTLIDESNRVKEILKFCGFKK